MLYSVYHAVFQCEIDSIDNLIESIDIIYKYSYNGEKRKEHRPWIFVSWKPMSIP